MDIRFRRQAPIGRYIVDFGSHSRKLVVEVDGAPHEVFSDQAVRDMKRNVWLATQGYRVLRFTNAEVMEDIEAVLATIQTAAA